MSALGADLSRLTELGRMTAFGVKQPSASAYQSLPTQSSPQRHILVGSVQTGGNYQISWVADSETRLAKETRGALDRWPRFMKNSGQS